MERLNRTSPFAIPRTRTADLTQPTAPTTAPAGNAKPPREATYKPSELAQREALIGEASQRDYGAMPWATPPARMSPEQRQEVIEKHKGDPTLIEQASDFTCAATTIQRWLATNDKASYERMANELSESGTTKLPNGDDLTISPENLAYLDSLNLPPERHVNAVVQTALMGYANGEAGFDIKTGKARTAASAWPGTRRSRSSRRSRATTRSSSATFHRSNRAKRSCRRSRRAWTRATMSPCRSTSARCRRATGRRSTRCPRA